MPRACATTSAASCSKSILEGEEAHVDFIETQFELIARIGIERIHAAAVGVGGVAAAIG